MLNGPPIVKASSRFAMVKRIIRHGQYERLQKTIFDQVRKRNRKLWGVHHALDVQFDFEKEMQEVNDLKKGVQNTRFIEAVEDIQDAINRAQAEEKQEDNAKEFDGICASLGGFLPDHPATSSAPSYHINFVHDFNDHGQYEGGEDIHAHAQRIADAIKRQDEALGDSSSFLPAASSPTIDKGDPSQQAIP